MGSDPGGRLHNAQQRVSNARADTQRRMRAVLDSAGREKRDVVYARLEKQYGGDNTGPPPSPPRLRARAVTRPEDGARPRFSFYTHAESGWKCAAESREKGRSGSRARGDRPSKKPTPLPQRRRPHANQIKGRSRSVVRPAARTRFTAYAAQRPSCCAMPISLPG